jgi:hypothetical protein
MHVFGKKAESGVLADALMLRRSFTWNNQGDPGKPGGFRSREPTRSRRSDNDPPAALGHCHVHDRLEIQLFHEEPPAPFLIPDPERDKI